MRSLVCGLQVFGFEKLYIFMTRLLFTDFTLTFCCMLFRCSLWLVAYSMSVERCALIYFMGSPSGLQLWHFLRPSTRPVQVCLLFSMYFWVNARANIGYLFQYWLNDLSQYLSLKWNSLLCLWTFVLLSFRTLSALNNANSPILMPPSDRLPCPSPS